jgi:hypothetical protein
MGGAGCEGGGRFPMPRREGVVGAACVLRMGVRGGLGLACVCACDEEVGVGVVEVLHGDGYEAEGVVWEMARFEQIEDAADLQLPVRTCPLLVVSTAYFSNEAAGPSLVPKDLSTTIFQFNFGQQNTRQLKKSACVLCLGWR